MMAGEDDDDVDGRMIMWPLERLARIMRAREHEGGLNPAQWEALRYLSRANRFSDSPGALTRYLGATKGTISQTLMALERKHFCALLDNPKTQERIMGMLQTGKPVRN